MSNPHPAKPFKDGPDPRRNRNGRPRRGESLAELAREYLAGREKVGGRMVERRRRFIEAVYQRAVDGSVPAAELLWERCEGRVPYAIQALPLGGMQDELERMSPKELDRALRNLRALRPELFTVSKDDFDQLDEKTVQVLLNNEKVMRDALLPGRNGKGKR